MWSLGNARLKHYLNPSVFGGEVEVARRLRLAFGMNKSVQCLFAVCLLMVLCLSAGGCAPARFENEVGFAPTVSESQAEIPTGLRRTNRGWEDASLWFVSDDFQPRSLEWWIDDQQRREPRWARAAFDRVRRIPPLMIAVMQITAIAGIAHVGRVRKAKQGQSQTGPAV